MTYRTLAHAARAHIEGEVVATPAKRSLAHAARAHISGERVEEPAKPSLAHSARIQVDESEIARRKEIVRLVIKPNSLSDIASRIGRIDEADNVGEKGVISSTDNTTAGGPPEAEPKAADKKKKASAPDPDDPNSLTFGIGNPVDLAPTTDNPITAANNDKKDKKVVESKEEKTFPKGIQLGNYHRNIRSRVMKIMSTNQNLVKKHGIIPAEPKKEEVELDEVVKMINQPIPAWQKDKTKNTDFPVHINPGPSAMKRLVNTTAHGDVRFIKDHEDNHYAWDADTLLHHEVAHHFGLGRSIPSDKVPLAGITNKAELNKHGHDLKKISDGKTGYHDATHTPHAEEVELAEAGFDPFKATGELVQIALLGGHRFDRRRSYHGKKAPVKAKAAEPAPHPNDDKPLPKVPTMRSTNKGKTGLKASDAIARYRERLRRGETTKKPLFNANGDYQKRDWTESVE